MGNEIKSIVGLEKKINREIEDRTSVLIDGMAFYCSVCNNELLGFSIYSREIKKASCDAPSICAAKILSETYKHKKTNKPATLYRVPIGKLRELWEKQELKPNFNHFKKSKGYLDLMDFKSKALGLCKTIKEIKYGRTEDKKIKTSNGITLHLSKEFLNLNFKGKFLIPMSTNSSQIENGITLDNFYDMIIANSYELSNIYEQLNRKK